MERKRLFLEKFQYLLGGRRDTEGWLVALAPTHDSPKRCPGGIPALRSGK